MSHALLSNRIRIGVAALSLAALASGSVFAADVKVTLTGANEVPPVTTSASGDAMFTIADDGTVSGSLTTKGITSTAAHIHTGAAGQNGPVIVPLTKEGDNYKTAAGAKLTAEQMARFKAGELYLNVHSAANPGGEIRGQLK